MANKMAAPSWMCENHHICLAWSSWPVRYSMSISEEKVSDQSSHKVFPYNLERKANDLAMYRPLSAFSEEVT